MQKDDNEKKKKTRAGRPKKYDYKEVQRYYDKGNSLRDCIQKFGMAKRTIEAAAQRGDLITRPQRLPIEYYLVGEVKTSRHYLKKRLLQEKLLVNKCAECGQGPKWRGKKLSLDLDHINGNKIDNRLENLRILCPNCHRITDTFGGKNPNRYKYKKPRTQKGAKLIKKKNE